jgi:pyruvate formate lyase activating enzyme
MKPGFDKLPISGIVPFTTIDYPEHTAAVLFTQGCRWHCPYCHNPQLRPLREGSIDWWEVEHFLAKRQGWLQAVVISGGEPTIHESLPACFEKIRNMGFKTGLHTAGFEPDGLAGSLPFLDWVGMDIKAPMDSRYDNVTGAQGSCEVVAISLGLLRKWGKPFQLRFTHDSSLHQPNDILEINDWLAIRSYPIAIVQQARQSTSTLI